MGLGQMRDLIDIIQPLHRQKDQAGFDIRVDNILATVRAQVEHRHATSAWVNRAAYTNATAVFRIRTIPDLNIDESMVITNPDGRWLIDSVEQAGRYTIIEAHQNMPEGASEQGGLYG